MTIFSLSIRLVTTEPVHRPVSAVSDGRRGHLEMSDAPLLFGHDVSWIVYSTEFEGPMTHWELALVTLPRAK